MGGKNKKSFKKFAARKSGGLKDAIVKRKAVKGKRKREEKDTERNLQRMHREEQDSRRQQRETDAKERLASQKTSQKTSVEHMTVDSLFDDSDLSDLSASDVGQGQGPASDSDSDQEQQGEAKHVQKKKGKQKQKQKQDMEMDEEGSSSEEDYDIESHKAELEALKTSDPAFYAALQRDTPDLLYFQEEEEDQPAQAAAAAGQGKQQQKKKGKKGKQAEAAAATGDVRTLSLASLKRLQASVTATHSLKAMVKLLKVFKSACHLQDEREQKKFEDGSDDEEGDRRKFRKKSSGKKGLPAGNRPKLQLSLAQTKLFDVHMRFMLHSMAGVFDAYLKRDPQATSSNNNVAFCKRWKKLEPLVQSFWGNLLHYVKSSVDSKMLRYILARMDALVAYVAPFKRFHRRLVRALIGIWANETVQTDINTRIDAFLRIRQLCIELPAASNVVPLVLKASYLSFARNAKYYTLGTAQEVVFMRNSVVELYRLAPSSSYQLAFVYIRQLAIHLRMAINSKEKQKDSHLQCYNWQFLNSLSVWGHLLQHAAADQEDPMHALHPLIYPFTQVCLGVLGLNSNIKFFPLKVHLVQLVHLVCIGTNTYVPVLPFVLQTLQQVIDLQNKHHSNTNNKKSKQPSKAVKGNVLKTIEYQTKVADPVLAALFFHEHVVSEVCRLALEHYTIYSYTPAFPELCVVAKVVLKQFTKQTKMHKLKRFVEVLVARLDANANFVNVQRNLLALNPREVSECFSIRDYISRSMGGDSSHNARQKLVSPLDKLARLSAKGDSGEWDPAEADAARTATPSQQAEAKDAAAMDVDEAQEAQESQEEEQASAAEESGSEQDEDAADHVEDLVLSDSD